MTTTTQESSVEQVARTLYAQYARDNSLESPWDALMPKGQDQYRDKAREILQVIAEGQS